MTDIITGAMIFKGVNILSILLIITLIIFSVACVLAAVFGTKPDASEDMLRFIGISFIVALVFVVILGASGVMQLMNLY